MHALEWLVITGLAFYAFCLHVRLSRTDSVILALIDHAETCLEWRKAQILRGDYDTSRFTTRN